MTGSRVQLVDDDTLGSSKFSSSSISRTVVGGSSTTSEIVSDAGSYLISSSSTTLRNRPMALKTSELRKNKLVEPTAFQYQEDSNVRLDFESVGLVGREAQTAKLKDCFHRMLLPVVKEEEGNTPAHHKELVLISGLSGSGKSKVARSLEEEIQDQKHGIFVEGKFDMNASSEPYSGISKAFSELCQKTLASTPELIGSIQEGIHKCLENEADILVPLIPEMKEFIRNNDDDASEMIDIGTDDIENRLERIRFAFRVLMRVFCNAFAPVVLFIDDLQWADISSLQILDFLLSDTENENPLMIIGCYRSEAVNENSLLHNKMTALREKSEKSRFRVTEIPIDPLTTDGIQKIIDILVPGSNEAEVVGLASLCHKRTMGNPFFVVEFLKMLQLERLLLHNPSSKQWEWELDKIEVATMSTANVMVMLQDRLTKLPQQEQTILQCAAYLGSTFTEAMIESVWTTFGRRLIDARIERTSSLLQVIVNENILENCDGAHKYRWVHDKLQEAALQLSDQRRESFQLDIGRTLYYGLEMQQVEEELFTIVDLINNGNILKLPEFATANLRAAKKARDLSAFQSAAEYASHGIDLLVENKWVENRELALNLYIMGAEMELMLGKVDAANRYSKEVLSQSDLSPMETLPLKLAQTNVTGGVELKFKEAIAENINILKDLGCRLAWSRGLVPVQAITKFLRMVKRVKSMPSSFFDSMSANDDPKQKEIASIIWRTSYYGYCSGDMSLNLLCTCKLVDMTLSGGVNHNTAKSFALLGLCVIMVMQDYKTATKISDLALAMTKRFKGMQVCETTSIMYSTVLVWVRRLEECSNPMRDAVAEGMRLGDTNTAMWNVCNNLISLQYAIGKPLASILNDCPKIMMQCEDLAQMIQLDAVRVLFQMLLNLHHSMPNAHLTELEGDIFSDSESSETHQMHQAYVAFAKGELLFFNADYEVTAKRALAVGDEYSKLSPSHFQIMIETFHRAVALHAAALKTKKRKYRVEAKRLRRKISKWVDSGNPNVVYYHLLLTAEQLALDKSYDLAQEKYEEALAAVKQDGHLHHLGLINERYGTFLLEQRSLKEESEARFKEAIRYYREWGAMEKVRVLESRL